MSTVLSCFDRSAVMVQPWARWGDLCYCVDIQNPAGEHIEENIIKVGANILTWSPPEDVKIAFFFPPCTNLSVSGARWFKSKGLRGLIEALVLFNRAIEIAESLGCPYMIENPVSTVSTYYKKPDYIFQPWMYGDMYTKKTCLWTGGGFRMPEPIYITKPEGVTDMIHRMPPTKDRSDRRSITPSGFAQAVYEANK